MVNTCYHNVFVVASIYNEQACAVHIPILTRPQLVRIAMACSEQDWNMGDFGRYRCIDIVGKGSYGQVAKCTDR